ncbi:MAG: Cna B-type domain-containing protein [Bacteroidales bacterium]|nr:Cna B-type domain-containing protein [Bacteroidales bacterium]
MSKKIYALLITSIIGLTLFGGLQPVFGNPIDVSKKSPKSTTTNPGVKDVNGTKALIAQRTIDNSWYFWLDDAGVLRIRLKNNTTTGGLTKNYNLNSTTDWNNVWLTAPNGSDIRPQVKEVIFVKNNNNADFNFNEKDIAYMFKDFTNLEEIDFGDAVVNVGNVRSMFENCTRLTTVKFGNGGFNIVKDANLQAMFQNCISLKEIDLSAMTSNGTVWNMTYMFSGCTALEEVILNNPGFITRASSDFNNKFNPDTYAYSTNNGARAGGVMMQHIFDGCNKLKKVDMSNITIYGRSGGDDWNDWKQARELFRNHSALEEVYLNNTKFINVIDFISMFEGCANLKTVEMDGIDVSEAMFMTSMFKNCTSLESLDVSSFGTLGMIYNMGYFVEGCTRLKYLNMDNLDNTHIGPTKYSDHNPLEDNSITDNNVTRITGWDRECWDYYNYSDYKCGYSRDLGLRTCDSLRTLSARNSNVWMCKNNAGTPGNEYYNSSYDQNIYYFAQKQMDFVSDAGPAVTIETKRDYVDLITDRDGTSGNTPLLNGPADIADRGTNINIIHGDLNLRGAGHLPPGVYTILDDEWVEEEIEADETFYRIAFLQQSPYVQTGGNHSDLVIVNESSGVTYVNTDNIVWPDSGNYTIDLSGDPLTFTYSGAAVDVNGTRYNVAVIINKITYTELEKFPTRNHNRDHEYYEWSNHYYDDWSGGKKFYRTLLQVKEGDGIQFMNYAYHLGYPSYNYGVQIITGGSGVKIDFEVKIVGAEDPDKHFIFYANDLDVPYEQDWYNDTLDACYDSLPVTHVTHGKGGESIVLGEGNDLGSVQFASKTGLTVVEDSIVVSTGYDPSTPWSSFTVKANATGANYTWVSGVGCTTYALRDTKPQVGVKVTKVWDDGNNQDGIRPESVTVKLLADGDSVNVCTLNEGNSWEHSWQNLEVLNGSTPIHYTISEVAVNGYTTDTTSVLVDGTYTYTVTNTHAPEKMAIKVVKKWDDQNDYAGLRPGNVTVYLKKGNDTIRTTVLNAGNNWQTEWSGLDKYSNGEEISYTVLEKQVVSYDNPIISKHFEGQNVLIDTITNRRDLEYVKVKVNKVWDDQNNVDNMRPAGVVMQLYRLSTVEGVSVRTPVGDAVQVTANDGWEYEWSGLDKVLNGHEVLYEVDETIIPNGYTKTVTGNMTDGFVVTNTHPRNETEVAVSKVWDDEGNRNGKRTNDIWVQLYADDEPVESYSFGAGTIPGLQRLGEGSWTYTWRHLPANKDGEVGEAVVYRVDEVDVPTGYTKTITNSGNAFTITNTVNPVKVQCNVEKVWDDANNQDGARPAISVQLYADGNAHGEPVVLNSGNNYRHTWTGLDSCRANKVGEPIVYTVYEVGESGGKIAGLRGEYSVSYAPTNRVVTPNGTVTVTNAYTPETVNISAIKHWDDNSNQDGQRPAELTYTLYKNNTEIETKTVSGNNATDEGWTWTWSGLPKYENGQLIEYKVTESNVNNYTHTDGDLVTEETGNNADHIFTNHYVPGTTTVTVSKVWDDANDQDALRPASVQVQLQRKTADTEWANVGTAVTLTHTEGNDSWTHRFSDLDVYASGMQGVEYEYRVVEVGESGGQYPVGGGRSYTVTYGNPLLNTFTVTNALTPETRDLTVTKVWDDDNNRDGIRPDSVMVQLFADGTATGKTAVLKGGSWQHQFTDLPKYAGTTTPISYIVKEYAMDANGTVLNSFVEEGGAFVSGKYLNTSYQYDGGTATITNTHTPATVSISGSKIWDDADNQDGIRPGSILIRLMADGEKVDSVTVTGTDWTWTFSDMPKYKYGEVGQEIVYSFTEKEVENYTTEVSVGNVINTHVPETVNLAATKVWDDDNATVSRKPVQVQLYKTTVATADFNPENISSDWTLVGSETIGITGGTAIWNGMDKYDNGMEIRYAVRELSAPVGYIVSYANGGLLTAEGEALTETITNTIKGGTEFQLTVGKNLTGRDWQTGDAFEMGLFPQTSEAPMPASTATTTSGQTYASAIITPASTVTGSLRTANFAPITIGVKDLEGKEDSTFIYTIRELTNAESGIARITGVTYSTEVYQVRVKVSIGTDALKVDQISYIRSNGMADETPFFTNRYNEMKTNYHLHAEKVLHVDGSSVTPADGAYSFTLTPVGTNAAKAPMPAGTMGGTLTVTNSGSVVNFYNSALADDGLSFDYLDLKNDFSDEALAAGVDFEYEIREVIPSDAVNTGNSIYYKQSTNNGVITDLYYDGTVHYRKYTVRIVETGGQHILDIRSTYNDIHHDYYLGSDNTPQSLTQEQFALRHTEGGAPVFHNARLSRISIPVVKSWVDNNNAYNTRPAAVTVQLKANGTVKEEAELNEANGWATTFSNLPLYEMDANFNATPIIYNIVEISVPNYTAATSGDMASGFAVENRIAQADTVITVSKVWDDANNQDGKRPAAVALNLRGVNSNTNAVVISRDTTLNAANNWSATYLHLPKYDLADGSILDYSLSETTVSEGYTQAVNGFTVTNTHVPALTQVTVRKVWDDQNNNDHYRPAELTLTLTGHRVSAPDSVYRTITIGNTDQNNEQSWTFSNLPVFHNGDSIRYTVAESSFANQSRYTTLTEGFTITNSHAPDSVTLTVSKFWDDNNNSDGLRTPVQIVLYQTTETDITFSPDSDNEGWTAIDTVTVSDLDGGASTDWKLPKYLSGKTIRYAVKEITAIADYVTSYANGGLLTAVNGYTETVNNRHRSPVAVTLGVQKQLTGRNWFATDTFDIALIPRDESNPMPGTTSISGIPFAVVKIAEDNTLISDAIRQNTYEPIVFRMDDLNGLSEKTFTYTLRELNPAESGTDRIPGITYSGQRYDMDITVSDNGSDALTITDIAFFPVIVTNGISERGDRVALPVFENTYNDSVTIYHPIADKGLITFNASSLQSGDFTFQLKAVGENADVAPMPANTVTEPNGDRVLTTTNVGNAIRFFDGNDDGLRFDYMDLRQKGFTDSALLSGIFFEYTMREVIPDDATNNGDGTLSRISGGVETVYDATVHYRRLAVILDTIGNKAKLRVTKVENIHKDYYLASSSTDTVFLTSGTDAYTMRHGFGGSPIFLNARIARTEVAVSKNWVDNQNAYGTRPASVTVRLLANGIPTDSTAVLSAANNWTHTFTNLPSGKLNSASNVDAISYSVQEVTVENYTTTYSGSMAAGYVVTNTIAQRDTAIAGTKTWIDPAGSTHPAIKIVLYRDNAAIDTATLPNGILTYAFNNLPKYDLSDGHRFAYTVKELPVEGYNSVQNSFNFTNTIKQEVTSIAGTKEWIDPARTVHPDINIVLLRDAEPFDSITVHHGTTNFSFDNLNKYDLTDGHIYQYAIVEREVPGYTSMQSGNRFTNIIEQDYTSISGTKTWIDPADMPRPTVTIVLMMDGDSVDYRTITSPATDYIFDNLPMYDIAHNGHQFLYTVKELPVAGYTSVQSGNNFTNTIEQEYIDIPATKVWADFYNQDGVRPSSVTLILTGSDGSEREQVLSGTGNSWSYTFEHLPVFHTDGSRIQYTLDEPDYLNIDLNGLYEKIVDGYTVTNTHTPDSIILFVEKVWSDHNNIDGIRPASLDVELLADGITLATATLSESNSWTDSLGKFPVNRDGFEIFYSLYEEEPAGYRETGVEYSFVRENVYKLRLFNKHTPDSVRLAVAKHWDDNDNQDGIRPEQITVQLTADGNTVATRTLTSLNGWSADFGNLPKHKNQGEVILYSLTEDPVDRYTPAAIDVLNTDIYDTYTLNIINRHEPDSLILNVTKIWVDHHDNDGVRPATVTVTLLADGNPVGTCTMSGTDNQWTGTFGKWPVKQNGSAVNYSLSDDVEGYSFVSELGSTTTSASTLKITNTHVPDSVVLIICKHWDDNQDADHLRQPVKVVLYRNAHAGAWTSVDTATIGIGGEYSTVSWKMPKFDNREPVQYVVRELDAPEGYITTYGHNGQLTAATNYIDTITNRHRSPVDVTLDVRKQLQGREWFTTDTFALALIPHPTTNPMPAVSGVINEIPFAMTLINASNITGTADLRQNSFPPITFHIEDLEGKSDTTFTYTIRELSPAESGMERIPGISYSTQRYAVDIRVVDVDGDSLRIADVAYYPVTVVDGSEVRGSRESVPTITNSHNNTVTYYHPRADKSLAYIGTGGLESGDFTFQLKAVGDYADIAPMPAGTVTESNGDRILTVVNTNSSIRFFQNDEDGFRFSYTDLREHFTDSALIAGVVFNYQISEVIPSGAGNLGNGIWSRKSGNVETFYDATIHFREYTVKMDTTGGNVTMFIFNKTSETFPDYYLGATVTDTVKLLPGTNAHKLRHGYGEVPIFRNARIADTTLTVRKIWDDYDDTFNKRPASITAHLIANGTETVSSATLTATTDPATNWRHTFTGLPMAFLNDTLGLTPIVYTVSEGPVANYTASFTAMPYGYDVTNALTPESVQEYTSVTVSKSWVDPDDIIHPDILIRLLRDGVKIDSTTLSHGQLSYTFNHLPIYDIVTDGVVLDHNDGEPFLYTIEEKALEGYNTVVDGYHVTNTIKQDFINIPVTKTWADNSNQDGLRPNSIIVTLNGSDHSVRQITLSGTGDIWDYTFEHLPVYNTDGSRIQYALDEPDALSSGLFDHYTKAIDNSTMTVTNSHTPDSLTLFVQKVWDDNNDVDGIRPGSLTVELRADNVAVATETLNTANSWKSSFGRLPVKSNGHAIDYTVVETEPSGYTQTSIEKTTVSEKVYNMIITNRHTPDSVHLAVTKQWDDNNNQDGIRPASVVVHLTADGSTVATRTLSQTQGWTADFGNLPKYRNHGQVIVYTLAETPAEGYVLAVADTLKTDTHSTYTLGLTNRHVPDSVTVNITKVWNDHHNNDGMRPESAVVTLLANDVAVDTRTVSAATGWIADFGKRPVNLNGATVNYSLRDNVAGYSYAVEETTSAEGEQNLLITNTHVPDSVTLTVYKHWDDDFNAGHLRTPVTMQLYSTTGENAFSTETVSEGWTAVGTPVTIGSLEDYANVTWKLPKYASTKVIRYAVREVSAPADYITTYANGGVLTDGQETITNRHRAPVSVSLDARKRLQGRDWFTTDTFAIVLQPKSPENAPLPESHGIISGLPFSMIQLTSNDDFLSNELRDDAFQSITFTTADLAGAAEKTFTYSIRELLPSESGLPQTPGMTYSNSRFEAVVTIRDNRTDSLTASVEYYKIVDGGRQLMDVPSFTNRYSDSATVYPIRANKNLAHSNAEALQNGEFSFILKPVGENAAVAPMPANALGIGANRYYEAYNQGNDILFYDGADDGLRFDHTELRLAGFTDAALIEGVMFEYQMYEMIPDEAYNHNNGIRSLKVGGVETFYDAVVHHRNFNVKLDTAGGRARLNVIIGSDTIHNDYYVKDDNQKVFLTSSSPAYKLRHGFGGVPIFLNARVGDTTVTVHKTWEDYDNVFNTRSASVTVNLIANGSSPVGTAVLEESNDWRHTFSDLPSASMNATFGLDPITYTVEETAVSHYVSHVNPMSGGFNIHNAIIPEEMQKDTAITVTKTWIDPAGTVHPDIKIYLRRDGLKVDSVVLTNGQLTHTFSNLPVFDLAIGGIPIEHNDAERFHYTIDEYPVAGYGTTIVDGHITNTIKQAKVEIAGTKVWVDPFGTDNMSRPDLRLSLHRDGALITTESFGQGATSWAFPNLDKYDLTDGHEYAYSVEEVQPEGYTSVISGNVITNTINQEYLNIPVSKVWSDNSNQDGIRPGSVKLTLSGSDGSSHEATLSGGNNVWSWTFTNLPKYAVDGQNIVYTLTEEDVAGYLSSVTGSASGGFTVTNTHTPATADLTAWKFWEDNNNAEGLRQPVTVQLYRTLHATADFNPSVVSGHWEPVGTPKTVSTAPAHVSTVWNDMPLYKDGQKYRYAVRETNVPEQYVVAYSNGGLLTAEKAYTDTITNHHYASVTAAIPVQKVLQGRDWLETDTFEMALIPKVVTDPMPANATTGGGIPYAPVLVTASDLPATDPTSRIDHFLPITFTTDDMGGATEKTFLYNIRELTFSESGVTRVPGVTYGTERYEVQITVRVGTDNNLEIANVAYFEIFMHEGVEDHRVAAEIPSITNTFNSAKTIYHLVADKQLTVHGGTPLQSGEFHFKLRPVGALAAIAPMPSNTTGYGLNRTLTVSNEGNAIRFYDESIPDDGLVFDHESLLLAGITDAQLAVGVEFEYELSEVIPDDAVNNDDCTWSRTVTISGGLMEDETYDALVHLRKIIVKLTEDAAHNSLLVVSGTSDDHHGEYYVKSTGDTVFILTGSEMHAQRHGTGGVPVFQNTRTARTSVEVRKVWDDWDNELGTRPDEITVVLLANGVETETVATLNSGNGWQYTFTNLPSTADGNEIVYTVQEVSVNHYESDYDGDMTVGFTITNTLSDYGIDEDCGIIVSSDQLSNCPDITCNPVTDEDGITYDVVKIDGYCWMAENLRKQTPGALSYQSAISSDASANVAHYGYLYTWNEAAGGTDNPVHVNGYVRGICPSGWHLPTTKEINVLRTNSAEFLKSTGDWVAPGFNTTGFNALPAGFYNSTLSRFEGLHTITYFHGDEYGEEFGITYHCCKLMIPEHESPGNGYSVRCVKDCE